MWVFVCVSGHPFINDCCNNRRQSCKVRRLLVNNVQNIIPQRLTANEPITGPLNLCYLLKNDRITQLHYYIIYTTRGRSVLSALRGCSAHLWSNSEKLSSVMDGLIDSHMRFDQEAKSVNVYQCKCFPLKGSTLIIVMCTLILPLKTSTVHTSKVFSWHLWHDCI